MRLSMLRALLWAGLRKHHPKVTELEAGEFFTKADGNYIGERILTAFGLSFAQGEAAGEGSGGPQEPAPEDAGTTSSS